MTNLLIRVIVNFSLDSGCWVAVFCSYPVEERMVLMLFFFNFANTVVVLCSFLGK